MLTVHHLEYSQSFRIVWLLEELKVVEYELKLYKRNQDNSAPKELQDLSPLGTAPVITDELSDGTSIVLCESNAIIDYILDKAEEQASQAQYENSAAASTIQRKTNFATSDDVKKQNNHVDYLFWYHSCQGTLQPLIQVDSLFRIMQTKVPFPLSTIVKLLYKKLQINYLLPRLSKYLTLLETQLGKNNQTSSVVGGNNDHGDSSITAADITLIYPMDVIFSRYNKDHDFASKYPNCMKWLESMRSRPAFQRAQEKVHENTTTRSSTNNTSGGRISKDL